MNLVRSPQSFSPAGPSVVTVGNFDGVHRGHAALLRIVRDHARDLTARGIVVTFEPHTRSVTAPGTIQPVLTTTEEKAVLVEALGIDDMVCLQFDESYAQLEPEYFVESVLVDRLHAVEWVMGEGHAFGRDRRGTLDTLHRVMEKIHINIFAADPVVAHTETISSTSIRAYVAEGRIAEAVDRLGHPYLILARRVRGMGRGLQLGFPTLNFEQPASPKVLPRPGVYAARLEYRNGACDGALYFGSCPTFGNRELHLEFFALERPEADPEVGEVARIWVLDFVRPDRAFCDPAGLTEQMEKDTTIIQHFFKGARQNATH